MNHQASFTDHEETKDSHEGTKPCHEGTNDHSYPSWIGMDGARSQMLMSLGMISSLGNDDLSPTNVKAFSTSDDGEAFSTAREAIERAIRNIERARGYRLQEFLRPKATRFLMWCCFRVMAIKRGTPFKRLMSFRIRPIHRDSESFRGFKEWCTSCCLREWHGFDQTYDFDTLKAGSSFYHYTVSDDEIAQMGNLYNERIKIERIKNPEDRLALHELLHQVALTVLPEYAVPPFGPVFD